MPGQDFNHFVQFAHDFSGKRLSQVNECYESTFEVEHPFDVSSPDLRNEMRHRLDHILAYPYYVGCAVDDQTRSPSVEIRDDDSVVRVRGRAESAKPLSEV